MRRIATTLFMNSCFATILCFVLLHSAHLNKISCGKEEIANVRASNKVCGFERHNETRSRRLQREKRFRAELPTR